jgi:hypothetical protein
VTAFKTAAERAALTAGKMSPGTLRGTASVATTAAPSRVPKHYPITHPVDDRYTAAGHFPADSEMADDAYALLIGSGTYQLASFIASTTAAPAVEAIFELYQESVGVIAQVNVPAAGTWLPSAPMAAAFTITPTDRVWVRRYGAPGVDVAHSVIVTTLNTGPVVPLVPHPGSRPPRPDRGFTAPAFSTMLAAGDPAFATNTWRNFTPDAMALREFRVVGEGRADLTTRIMVRRLTAGAPVIFAAIDAPTTNGPYDLTVPVAVTLPAGAEIDFAFQLGVPGITGTWNGFTPYLYTAASPAGVTDGFVGANWAALP